MKPGDIVTVRGTAIAVMTSEVGVLSRTNRDVGALRIGDIALVVAVLSNDLLSSLDHVPKRSETDIVPPGEALILFKDNFGWCYVASLAVMEL